MAAWQICDTSIWVHKVKRPNKRPRDSSGLYPDSKTNNTYRMDVPLPENAMHRRGFIDDNCRPILLPIFHNFGNLPTSMTIRVLVPFWCAHFCGQPLSISLHLQLSITTDPDADGRTFFPFYLYDMCNVGPFSVTFGSITISVRIISITFF